MSKVSARDRPREPLPLAELRRRRARLPLVDSDALRSGIDAVIDHSL